MNFKEKIDNKNYKILKEFFTDVNYMMSDTLNFLCKCNIDNEFYISTIEINKK